MYELIILKRPFLARLGVFIPKIIDTTACRRQCEFIVAFKRICRAAGRHAYKYINAEASLVQIMYAVAVDVNISWNIFRYVDDGRFSKG